MIPHNNERQVGECLRQGRERRHNGLQRFASGCQSLSCAAVAFEAVSEHHQRFSKLGSEGVGTGGSQLAADGDRLLGRGQRLLAPAEGAEPVARLLSAMARPGRKASGRARGQLAIEVGGLLGRGQRRLPPAKIAQSCRPGCPARSPGTGGKRRDGRRPARDGVGAPPRPRPAPPPAGRGRSGC